MIFQPITLNNVVFKNRILRSSVGGRTCAYNSMVTDVWKNFEMRFGRGGVGGIISTTFHVEPERQAPFEYPSIADDKFIEPLRKQIVEIKETGCRYIVQIGDPGYVAQTSLFAKPSDALSSSGGFDLLYGYTNCRVAMTDAQIVDEIDKFAKAAKRVQCAGADGIEITAEKGYIIHQFLNPGLNRRKDRWGGAPDNRFLLLSEIAKAVRKAVGDDFLLGVRLSAVDYNCFPLQNFVFRLPWVFPLRYHYMGNEIEQTLEYGKQLKDLRVDFLHIVSGTGFINPKGTPGAFPLEEFRLFCNETRHLSFKAAARATVLNMIPSAVARLIGSIGWRYVEGISLDHAARFQREVGIPVIVNGGFQHRHAVEDALTKCDFVSMARALIANPDLVNRWERGLDEPDHPCTFCNRCAARTATSPLGCYEPKRFDSISQMQEQILDWNTPDA
jgi:2,4-dienoyl-CoA reductase-like NADH-dependent reductase (Old Yellow Enzyme family)